MNPIARSADVIVQELGAETLVYDRLRDTVHSLGPIVAFVFGHADGERSIEDIAALMHAELGTEHDAEIVRAALSELRRAHLLQRQRTRQGTKPELTRRQAVRRLGLAAAALPIVAGVAFPTVGIASTQARGSGHAASGQQSISSGSSNRGVPSGSNSGSSSGSNSSSSANAGAPNWNWWRKKNKK